MADLSDGAIAWVETTDRCSCLRFQDPDTGNALVVSGLPISSKGSVLDVLARLTAGDHRQAAKALSRLDGAFAAVFWDATQRRLIAVTDFLGMQPLYCYQGEGLLLLATELKAITASGLVGVDMNPVGWGSFLSFGHLIGDQSMVSGIRQVPGATILSYDCAHEAISETTYWDWPEVRTNVSLEDVDTGAMVEALVDTIQGYTAYETPGQVTLSGGFDSRFILAAMEQRGMDPKALIVDHPDELHNADGRYAVRIAKELGVPFSRCAPDKSFYSSPEFISYMAMNEVVTPSLYLFIANVAMQVDTDTGAVWDGLIPGAIINPLLQEDASIEGYVARASGTWESGVWQAARRVFQTNLTQQCYDAMLTEVARESERHRSSDGGAYRFAVANLTRTRMAPNPLKVVSNRALAFVPGMSKAFWETTATIPHAVKKDFALYCQIFRRHFPHIAHIPVCSFGGKRVDCRHGKIEPSLLGRAENFLTQYGPVKRLARRLSISFQWERSTHVSAVLARINPEHPDLNPSAVVALQRTGGRMDPTDEAARRLLFYWQMWRWVLEGAITPENSAKVCKGTFSV